MPVPQRDHPTNTLSIRGSVEDNLASLQLNGPLARRTTDRLDSCLVQLRRSGVHEVELDLRHLTRLDSAGVALLLRLQHRARARAGACAWSPRLSACATSWRAWASLSA